MNTNLIAWACLSTALCGLFLILYIILCISIIQKINYHINNYIWIKRQKEIEEKERKRKIRKEGISNENSNKIILKKEK